MSNDQFRSQSLWWMCQEGLGVMILSLEGDKRRERDIRQRDRLKDGAAGDKGHDKEPEEKTDGEGDNEKQGLFDSHDTSTQLARLSSLLHKSLQHRLCTHSISPCLKTTRSRLETD